MSIGYFKGVTDDTSFGYFHVWEQIWDERVNDLLSVRTHALHTDS